MNTTSAFFLVLYDLWDFVWQSPFFGLRGTNQGNEPDTPEVEPSGADIIDLGEDGSTRRSEARVKSTLLVAADNVISTYTVAFIFREATPVYLRPVVAFDEVLAVLPYGDSVRVLRYEGRFGLVDAGSASGWVKKDDLTSVVADVTPDCHDAVQYDAHHQVTLAIRRFLKDEFGATELCLPLQAGEYASYRLKLNRQSIAWPQTRPRLCGDWHLLLRGQRLIRVSLTPSTGAVFEWRDDEGGGQLGFVEAVHPDGSIMLAVVGFLAEGIFTRIGLSKEECSAKRGVFIVIA